MFDKLLNFSNRQVVRLSWGYQKLLAPIGIVNTTAYIITALALTDLVEFTWLTLTILLGSFMVSILGFIYILTKSGTLQNETKQIFNERQSNLWQQQVSYQSILTAYLLSNENEREKLRTIKEDMEKRLNLNSIINIT